MRYDFFIVQQSKIITITIDIFYEIVQQSSTSLEYNYHWYIPLMGIYHKTLVFSSAFPASNISTALREVETTGSSGYLDFIPTDDWQEAGHPAVFKFQLSRGIPWVNPMVLYHGITGKSSPQNHGLNPIQEWNFL